MLLEIVGGFITVTF